ncbi:MAG: arylesterase [Pseudomonadota bacterium]
MALGASPAFAQDVTIAALGDSLTAGFGLAADEGFVPQLQAWLQARGHDVAILNAGVSGDTTAGGLARAAWTLTPGVDGMILALGGNDLLRGLPAETARQNLAGILHVAAAQDVVVLLAGLPAPANFGAAYQAEFNAIYPDLAAEFDTIYVADFLAGLQLAFEAGVPRSDLLLPDGIHPTAQGVTFMVEEMGPAVEALIAEVE